MRYRGVIFKPLKGKELIICFPFKKADGTNSISKLHKIPGEYLDVEPNELLIAEFLLYNKDRPITLQEFMDLEEGSLSKNDISTRSIVVAKTTCESNVFDMFTKSEELFVGFCVDRVMEAHRESMFDEEMLLSEWNKAGCDPSVIGDAVEMFTAK